MNQPLLTREFTKSVSETGLSVVYEPKNATPVVDIILVHGLQGHPYKTWACRPGSQQTEDRGCKQERRTRQSPIRRALHKAFSRPLSQVNLCPQGTKKSNTDHLFWPGDLLPDDCPSARILVYGYDTRVTKYLLSSSHKGSIFSHSEDLLCALGGESIAGRSIIFVAHSLGGIIVKEMLARSSASKEERYINIVQSTFGIIFLGTPHRGSPELSSLADWGRGLVSVLRMDTNASILQSLSLRNEDLERAQESFSILWRDYNFRVKTFQEGLGLTRFNFGILGRKVVPDFSSAIGDAREHAEKLQANHMEMCRFRAEDDPNYKMVKREIIVMYASVLSRATNGTVNSTISTSHGMENQEVEEFVLPKERLAILKLLRYPEIDNWRHIIDFPSPKTCEWLFENRDYQSWFDGKEKQKYFGLLWLKGKPGSGKSTLVRQAFLKARADSNSNVQVAGHFFQAKGVNLERSSLGMFRSLLHQLLSQNIQLLWRFLVVYHGLRGSETNSDSLQETELRHCFKALFQAGLKSKIIIFVDALDECESQSIRSLAYFWREVTKSASASGVELLVCLSSRNFPTLTVADCLEIIVDVHNRGDIESYIDARFDLVFPSKGLENTALRQKVINMSGGVFLWAVLVVDSVLEQRDQGQSIQSLLNEVDCIPDALETLFHQILSAVEPDLRDVTLRLFQWAILTTRTLDVNEWRHIIPLIQSISPLSSLQNWKTSGELTEANEELEKQIRVLSRGLLEVSSLPDDPLKHSDDIHRDLSGAGSQFKKYRQSETRYVRVIHESVRDFFLHGSGFCVLESGQLELSESIAKGHVSIIHSCLDYIGVQELANYKPRKVVQRSERAAAAHALRLEEYGRHAQVPSALKSPLRHAQCFSAADTWSVDVNVSENTSSYDSSKSLMNEQDDANPRAHPQSFMLDLYLRTDGGGIESLIFRSWNCSTSHHSSEPIGDSLLLLQYIQSAFFTHARLADKAGADPDSIITRVREPEFWRRWLSLDETEPSDTQFLYYLAGRGLNSWIVRLIRAYESPRPGSDIKTLVSSAIMQAIHSRSSIALEVLLEHNFETRFETIHGNSFVHALVYQHSTTMLNLFLAATVEKCHGQGQSRGEAIIEHKDSNGRTGLHVAVLAENLDAVISLIQFGARVCTRDTAERTPLHSALSQNPNYELARLLVTHGACVNARDKAGQTPLHLACIRGLPVGQQARPTHIEVVRLLLSRGAEVNVQDKWGITPLHLACFSKSAEHIRVEGSSTAVVALFEASVGIDAKKGDVPPHSSIPYNGIVEHLGKLGISVMPQHSTDFIPLHLACKRGLTWAQDEDVLEVVSTLLRAGANTHATDNYGQAPIHVAAAVMDSSILSKLVQFGADILARDETGRIPMHEAASAENQSAVSFLLRLDKHQADIADQNNHTPLHLAMDADVRFIEKLLNNIGSEPRLYPTLLDFKSQVQFKDSGTSCVRDLAQHIFFHDLGHILRRHEMDFSRTAPTTDPLEPCWGKVDWWGLQFQQARLFAGLETLAMAKVVK